MMRRTWDRKALTSSHRESLIGFCLSEKHLPVCRTKLSLSVCQYPKSISQGPNCVDHISAGIFSLAIPFVLKQNWLQVSAEVLVGVLVVIALPCTQPTFHSAGKDTGTYLSSHCASPPRGKAIGEQSWVGKYPKGGGEQETSHCSPSCWSSTQDCSLLLLLLLL